MRKFVLWGIGIVVLLMWIFIPPYAEYVQKKQEYAKLKKEVGELKVKKKELEDQLMRIENDPIMVEEIARKKLGMSKPGEVVYVPAGQNNGRH